MCILCQSDNGIIEQYLIEYDGILEIIDCNIIINIPYIPGLTKLYIYDCNMLNYISSRNKLINLTLWDCPNIDSSSLYKNSLIELTICNSTSINFIPQLSNLYKLEIINCVNHEIILADLPRLHHLTLSHTLIQYLPPLNNLKIIELDDNDNLKIFNNFII